MPGPSERPLIPGTTQKLAIVPSYGPHWGSAPEQVQQGFAAACAFLENLICVSMTWFINVDWGYYEGFPISGGAAAESSNWGPVSGATYAQLRAGLIANARTATARSAIANSFPAIQPAGLSGSIQVPVGIGKAIGLIDPNAPPSGPGSVDGFCGYSSSINWFYQNQGSTWDAMNLIVHEITETMGRTLICDPSADWGPMDAMRYASVGTLQTGGVAASPSYFSVDGGATNLKGWNTSGSGDPGDWAASGDAFSASAGTGVVPVSAVDEILLDAMGFSIVPPT